MKFLNERDELVAIESSIDKGEALLSSSGNRSTTSYAIRKVRRLRATVQFQVIATRRPLVLAKASLSKHALIDEDWLKASLDIIVDGSLHLASISLSRLGPNDTSSRSIANTNCLKPDVVLFVYSAQVPWVVDNVP